MADPGAIHAFEYAGWERAADAYEAAFAAATRPFIPALLNAANVGAGCSVLDVACGPGFATVAAAGRGARVRGMDFSAAMLRVAAMRHDGIAFEHGDAEALPYPDDSFDSVVCNFGIHHLPRPLLGLREAHRVLRAGGSFAFTAWASPGGNIAWKLVFDAIRRHGDINASQAPPPGGTFASAKDCSAALAQAGFSFVATHDLAAVWHHADAFALLAALRAGTARMAALIEAQPAGVLPTVIADIDREAAVYRDANGLAIPIAAHVAFGRKI